MWRFPTRAEAAENLRDAIASIKPVPWILTLVVCLAAALAQGFMHGRVRVGVAAVAIGLSVVLRFRMANAVPPAGRRSGQPHKGT
jgi:hypothetical protein